MQRILIRPLADQTLEIDVTRRLVAVIAEELWNACGGNDHVNWIEAERHLASIVGAAHAEAVKSRADESSRPAPRMSDARVHRRDASASVRSPATRLGRSAAVA